jgi:2-phosphosulfolactate phosphatase
VPSAPDATSPYGQSDYEVRFDWGLDGALAVAVDVEAVVVVDVLSFTTAVSVAVDQGALVYPYRWRDESARDFAIERAATLAVKRGEEGVSLSPVSMRDLAPGDRVVLPSPNGATICAALADCGAHVIAGSIRNAAQVSALVNERGWSVAVIAAGECWPASSSVRPCLEDGVGAGSVLARLSERSHSPESLPRSVHSTLLLTISWELFNSVSGVESSRAGAMRATWRRQLLRIRRPVFPCSPRRVSSLHRSRETGWERGCDGRSRTRQSESTAARVSR